MNAEVKVEAAPAAIERRPRSAVSAGVGVAGFVGVMAWLVVARLVGAWGPLAGLIALAAAGVPMILWSLLVDKVHRSPTSGIDWSRPPRPLRETLDISIAKIAGLWATWAVIALAYCVARWYWRGPYLFSMYVLGTACVPLVIGSLLYVPWLDRRLREPRDGAWHLGQLIAGRSDRIDRAMLYEHARCWTIKAFFLAFMISTVPGNWRVAVAPSIEEVAASPLNLSVWLGNVTFMVDVVFATVGYVLTMKPLDAQIRSANPYAAGWMAALICYPPFALMVSGGPLEYTRGNMGEHSWAYWFDGQAAVMAVFAFLLVFLHIVYAWATVAFGLRFSNLTHRGIITHGPYKWTKHPAYLSKNLFWWLATLPFLATTGKPIDMVRDTALLALVSGVYYWRARTEERHLMADPAYRAYAEWMERRGPIPRLIRKLTGGAVPQPLPAE